MGCSKYSHACGSRASRFLALALLLLPLEPCVGADAPSVAGLRRLPLRFEPNLGQAAPTTHFVARTERYALHLRASEAVLALRAEPGRLVRLRLEGARPDALGSGSGELPGRSHYLTGRDPGGWRTDVPAYTRVRFEEVYAGIDLIYYGRGRDLEWDFVLAPGAEPGRIRIAFEGADSLEIDAQGSIALSVPGGTILLRPPVAYQEIGGHRRPVDARYVLSEREAGLRLAVHDPDHPLVVDPVLSFATYLGGSGADAGRAVAVDGSGYVYVAGETLSVDLPTAAPLQPTNAGGSNDAFVAKLAPDGAALVYATYLGGSLDDRGFSIAVDAHGNAHVTGRTSSPDFPTVNPIQAAHGGGANDAFAARISSSGASLLFSTFLGGSDDDRGLGIALDPAGNVVLTGVTLSADFPLQRPLQADLRGREDAFIAKLGAAGGPLLFSTYLGGSGTDNGRGIVADALGNVIVTGDTASPDFPTRRAAQATHGGGFDAYVAALDAPGAALLSSTFLGGSGSDFGLGIGRSLSGAVVVAGITSSGDFPTASPLQATLKGGADAFVVRVDLGAARLVYSTYLGGSGSDFALAVAVDPEGGAVVTGSTASADFPVVNAPQATPGGGFDAFVAKVNAAGSALEYSTYLGGSASELGFDRTGIAADALGRAYVVGITHSQDFPVRGAPDSALGGSRDAFVARIDPRPEIVLRLEEAGGQARLVALLANSGTTPQPVDLRLWVDSPSLGPPFPLGGTPTLAIVPPQPPTEVLRVLLPAALPFPGTRVGGRLLDPLRGMVLSESVCSVLPCVGGAP